MNLYNYFHSISGSWLNQYTEVLGLVLYEKGVSDIDKQLDQGGVNDDILLSRMDLMQQMQEHKLSDAWDNMQKAKVQWAIEGDKNSKYFHGMASILINGSPTPEFQFHCGLKQGDPLASYMFILIMESLHLLFSRVVDADIFKGIKIDTSVTIANLFYADDAVLIGVGVPDDIITSSAMNLGCSVMKTPFKYLGVMVGGDMSKIKAWDEMICMLNSCLSKWKLKTLSIEGRLTLLKSILGSTPIYSMSLYKVPKSVLNSMESIRRNFFNGKQSDEKKIAWVKWSKTKGRSPPVRSASRINRFNGFGIYG
uniref:RNA-directed DNA polymerase, eukaryota n=1 Tax=Tanacetum cinerariifolium TaxID=118510 RepID=A0A699JYN0_TANCI|nr:RNA-directed DNA polymerase, eukaryota [Tanacetum cinerariifolium]